MRPSAATARSQDATSWQPAAVATPWTLAMTGCGRRSGLWNERVVGTLARDVSEGDRILLDAGTSYHEISERTGASSATISRVNQWLRYGRDGYRLVLDRQRRARRRRR